MDGRKELKPNTRRSSAPEAATTATTKTTTTTGRRTTKPKRGQANKRERARTENVNVGFDNLRKLIPTEPKDRKLSKIEVLRLATSYINHLYNLTKADSCNEVGQQKTTNGYHVCTFCLMITKTKNPASNKKK